MLKFPEETENVIKPLVPDYPINLVEVRRISKEIRQKMTSDFALIAEYVARKKDAERLEELMSDNEHIIKHPEEFLDLLSEVANDEQYKSAREKLQNDEMELPEILYYEIRNKLDLDCLDNDRANDFAHKMSTELLSLLDDKKPYLGLGFLPASIQFNSAADAGRKIGATPDGRCDGAPLCESLGAIYSKDILGPTALLNSVVSLDLKRALGIPVLNFIINPKFDDLLFKSLILGYMDGGGIHMQVTCTTYEVLLEAYHNPELHRNLVVRVGGYSEYFNNLSDESKRLIINRMIYG